MDRRIDDVRSKVPLEWDEVGGFTEQQISAAGRVLADRSAEACNVDKDDNWKIYGDDFIEDARAAIRALASQTVPPSHLTLDWMGQEAQAHLDGLDADIARATPPVQQTGDVREAWEYSFTHSSALDKGDTNIGPCLTYDRSIAYGVGCFNQRQVAILAASGGAHAVPEDTARLDCLFSLLPMNYFCTALNIDPPANNAPVQQGKWARAELDRMIAAAPTQDQGEGK